MMNLAPGPNFQRAAPLVRNNDQQNRIKILSLYFIYYGLLCYLYISYLSVDWAYAGFNLYIEPWNIIFSIGGLTLFALMVPVQRDVRSILLNIFLSIYLVPFLVLSALGGHDLNAVLVVALCSVTMFQVSRVDLPSVELAKVSPTLFLTTIAFLSILLLFLFYFFIGFRYFNLDFRQVYNFRDDVADNLPPLFAYLSSTFSKLLIPLGVVAALIYRMPLVALGFAAISILFFGFTSHKSMAFYPLIAAIFYYALSKSVDYSKVLILLVAAVALCVVDIALMNLNGSESVWGWYTSLFLRRSLFVPPSLDIYYIEFFSSHLPVYWADSRLTFGLLQSPYDLPVPYLIGNVYFGDDTGANTGFIGSGFAQARTFGALLYSVGAGLTLALLNAHGKRQGVAFISSVAIIQMMTMFTSTDFLTLFISHGVLLAFLLLGLIDRPQPRRPAAR
ncbi:MAG: hypothetical protein WA978_05540 [Sphingopyxis granuli]|uniref:hypothetical protein n=1 Tax=Sphingopyxis granuli TaxID=267128 RepID=UPI003C74B995